MGLTSVVHISKFQYDVYIGRPSIWGNPFEIGKDGTRSEVIEKYKEYILGNQELLDLLPSLSDKILGCFCSPKRCHGDIIADLVNKLEYIAL